MRILSAGGVLHLVVLRFLCCFYNDMDEKRVKLRFKADNSNRVKLFKSFGKTLAIFSRSV